MRCYKFFQFLTFKSIFTLTRVCNNSYLILKHLCFYRRVPSLLEYFSYIFHHSSFLVGPVCSFKDYMDFIVGDDMARAKKVCRKLALPLSSTELLIITFITKWKRFCVTSRLLWFFCFVCLFGCLFLHKK